MLTMLFFLVTGLVLLFFGAQWLLRGSLHLAGHYGVSPLITGLTIVAFGTSAPELATSMISAYYGRGDISLGNVVGSNIVNIGLILGLTALFVPVTVSSSLNNRYIPFLIGASLVLVWFSRSLAFSRLEGLVFLILFAVFVWYAVKTARSVKESEEGDGLTGGAESAAKEPQTGEKGPQLALNALVIGASLVMLGFGADLFVRGAVDIARLAGLSEAVIGVTIVALGTSLPELAASVLAAARKLPGVALGNIVGSNIFNTLAIIGLSASIFPYAISPSLANVAIPVMLGFTLLLLVFTLTHRVVSRLEGVFLLLLTALYLGVLFLI